MLLAIFIPTILALSELVCSQPPHGARSSVSTFKLYAYGTDIEKLPVFYADGQAQIGDISQSNATNKVPIYVTFEDSSTTWLAHADNTDSTSADDTLFDTNGTSSKTNLLALTKSSALANPVSFANYPLAADDSSKQHTDVWALYGTTVLLSVTGANFYAQFTEQSGYYNLLWSDSVEASSEDVLLTLLADFE